MEPARDRGGGGGGGPEGAEEGRAGGGGGYILLGGGGGTPTPGRDGGGGGGAAVGALEGGGGGAPLPRAGGGGGPELCGGGGGGGGPPLDGGGGGGACLRSSFLTASTPPVFSMKSYMTFDVSLSLSCASEIPHRSKRFFNSGSKLFRSKPVFGSQPTCPMCWKLLGVPISALVNLFFLAFPFFFSLVWEMLLTCGL